MEKEEEKSQIDIDWENRILCIDESCIGVVGPDGRCNECGRPYEGKQPEDMPPSQNLDESSKEEEIVEDEEDELQPDIDWENRTLCIDESCIGVVGPDGCCKECGKPFKDI